MINLLMHSIIQADLEYVKLVLINICRLLSFMHLVEKGDGRLRNCETNIKSKFLVTQEVHGSGLGMSHFVVTRSSCLQKEAGTHIEQFFMIKKL